MNATPLQSIELEESNASPRTFWGNGPIGTVAGEILLFLGMVSDYLTGEYPRLPAWAIAAIVFTALYVLNPFDLVPDYILGIGQIDDLLAGGVGLVLIRQQIHAYRDWKERQVNGWAA